jgi:hypothetical protein
MDIINLLEANGPMLSSSIKKKLLNAGLSDVAARQQMSRVSKQIKKLPGNFFPCRAAFLYLKSHENTDKFFENLIFALKETNSVHFGAIAALAARGGKTNLEKFKVLSGAPIMRKKHKNFDLLMAELVQSKLVFKKQENDKEIIELHTSLLNAMPKSAWTDADEVIEELIAAAFANWIKKNGLGSYNKLKRNGEFNSYYWDITAPSYVFPLCEKSEQAKSGFVVVDILPQYDITEEQIRYFVKKFESTRSQYRFGRFLPILIGNNFSASAFSFGKKSGFIITTPANFFGEQVGALLSDLKNTLENMTLAVSKKTEVEITNMFKSVAKLEGKSNNIRGALFELVTGHMVFKKFGGIMDINKNIKNDNGEKTEIDVLCLEGNKAIRVFECKGCNANQIIDLSTVQRWEKKISIIRNWINGISVYAGREQHFEFWTTSSFKPEATDYIKRMKTSVKKYTVDCKAYPELLEIAKSEKLNSIYDLLNEHYGTYERL